MDSPRVLVGITTFNRADMLPRAIESAFAQTYSAIDVAVVDDGSTDHTPSVAARFPRAQWVRWPSSRGYAAARNHLMLEATAEYYASLDDDAWFLRGDEISLAIELMQDNPKIAAVAFDILSPDRSTATERTPATPVALFIGCGHVLRLDAVRRLNGYAVFPGSYGGEEKDLCLRLLDAGYEIARLPGVHVWHDKTNVARDAAMQHRSGVCNDLTLTLRRTPLALLPAAVGWKIARHLQFSTRARLLAPCLDGFRLVARSLPEIWGGREAVNSATLRRFARLSRG
jgi:GT2 family glycosyltransferase